ncbi:uncharacterized protein PpBr36_06499 [Pyricularia pennisetigena]|uniref:uncharacterized protein n=1 Tax=Pyricularia pennisetigena TaxID=1578925 RepID=UPI0011534356|nr:uncharacterized protein PpBr36_06499 [Pyricularia pennisetigena]TLS22691.1 hypothetical protein PpBr36_06499 [Pyricularia pennisetigena]
MTSASSLPESHRELLSRNDYIDLRNSQDQQPSAEFISVRESVGNLPQELKNNIDLVKDDVKPSSSALKPRSVNPMRGCGTTP